MSFLPILVLVAGGWIYTAAAFENYGDAWAVNTCTGLPGICDHPNSILYGAFVAAIAFYVVKTIKDI
jgi:hypothetical protein